MAPDMVPRDWVCGPLKFQILFVKKKRATFPLRKMSLSSFFRLFYLNLIALTSSPRDLFNQRIYLPINSPSFIFVEMYIPTCIDPLFNFFHSLIIQIRPVDHPGRIICHQMRFFGTQSKWGIGNRI